LVLLLKLASDQPSNILATGTKKRQIGL